MIASSASFGQETEFQFKDVAKATGLDFTHYSPLSPERHLHLFMGSGLAWCDFDVDGWPDLYFCQGAAWPPRTDRTPAHSNQLFRNVHGRFENVTEHAGLSSFGYSMGAAVGDYDNDGFPDIYVSCYGPDRFFRNLGDGTWAEVTDQPVLNDPRFGASCTWADIDGDGDLDLYVTNYLKLDPANYPLCSHVENGKRYPGGCHPRHQKHEYDRLLSNRGDGTFIDITESAGLLAETPRAGLGVVAYDFDEDGDQDFYIANDTVNNQLWVNSGKETFTDDALVMGVAVNGHGFAGAAMGIAAGDVDGDGRLDLFVTNYFNETNTLYRNDPAAFIDVTAEYGLAAPSLQRLGFGTSLFDADNDGWLDLIVANGHVQSYPPELDRREPFAQLPQIFRNQRGARFQEVSSRAGAYFQQAIVGRSTALADYNRDGRMDVAIQHLNGPAALLQNDAANAGRSLTLRLVGVRSNREALGARVEVGVGTKKITRFVLGSCGYLSGDDRSLVIGLGDAERAETVTVRWPSGQSESWGPFANGERHTLIEGRGVGR
ncbi:MAG TPA: CRTAC1 family protein [Planctomycetaceae bacterium]|nr:CRTAC1 family protein [Planctomycetaceae bacterium]